MTLVSLTVAAHVATLLIEPAHGLADRAFSLALADAAAEIAADTDRIRVAVVRAAGADFCAGWGADALAEPEGVEGVPALAAGIEALAAVPQPTLAAIHGRALSAGLELALACDIRIAAADAIFSMPETERGVLPRAGGSQRLPRAIGRAHALRLLLLGEQIDAAEALRIGLVSRVHARDALPGEAAALAGVIASRGPIATRLAKEAVHRGSELSLEQALRYELDLTLLLQTTADRAEGVRAFAAKRPPHFIGR